MTQHEKVIELCKDGSWHCQNEFRDNFIFSPHKRRVEIEGRKNRKEPVTGKYEFIERPCEHGIKGQKDYRMLPNPFYLGNEKEPQLHSSIREVKVLKSVETDIRVSPETKQRDLFHLQTSLPL